MHVEPACGPEGGLERRPRTEKEGAASRAWRKGSAGREGGISHWRKRGMGDARLLIHVRTRTRLRAVRGRKQPRTGSGGDARGLLSGGRTGRGFTPLPTAPAARGPAGEGRPTCAALRCFWRAALGLSDRDVSACFRSTPRVLGPAPNRHVRWRGDRCIWLGLSAGQPLQHVQVFAVSCWRLCLMRVSAISEGAPPTPGLSPSSRAIAYDLPPERHSPSPSPNGRAAVGPL